MDALTLIGHGIALTIGFIIGACVMYFGGLIIDNNIDRQEERT